MAVTSLPVLHHQPEADLATVTSIVTGWRHGTVCSITLMVVSSPPCPFHHQLGDMAMQEAEASQASGPRNCRLAPWYETGLGGPAVHSITGVLYWYYLYTLVLL